MVVVVSAAGVLSYPAAGNWFSDRRHAGQIASYVQNVDQMASQQIADSLAVARDYNANLPNGPLRDPYAVAPDGSPVQIGLGRDAYNNALNTTGTGVMARLMIPSIGVDLPIYHGTDGDSLNRGVGHLYGSGLPVGGDGVHSVLTAHSGVVGQTLFSNVHKMKMGDTFQIQVLDQVLWYKVDDIRTVLPDELESLRQQAGRDLVTLLTCTPIGVNTHRLLVTGERIPTPATAAAGDDSAPIPPPSRPGFPWWVLPTPGVALAAIALTRNRPKARMMRAAAPNGGTHDGPWVEAVLRRPGDPDFAVWASRRARALGAAAYEAPSGPAPRFADLAHARDFVAASQSEGVYTWTLRDPAGWSRGISAFAFPTAEAALADAEHWARRWYALISWSVPGGGGLSFWWVGPDERAPVLFQVAPTRTDDNADDARDAIAALATAHREVSA